MDNRPVGREKRVISGGEGIRRSGEGLGKKVSNRNVQRAEKGAEKAARSILGGLFGKKK